MIGRVGWVLAWVGLPLVGMVLGRLAGPDLARTHRTVQLADRIHLEDWHHLTERIKASEAFRATGRPAAELAREAEAIERTFQWGGAVLGFWIGLVVVAKMWGAARERGSATADIDHAACVCCARCFAWCPRERLRWKHVADRGANGG